MPQWASQFTIGRYVPLVVASAFKMRSMTVLLPTFQRVVAGDSLLESTTKGLLVSASQRARVISSIETAMHEGTSLLHGGKSYTELANSGGHFVPNTAFVDVAPTATVMREEIFGPVARIARFKTRGGGYQSGKR